MELANWPPSRGPRNPYEVKITYKPGKITRHEFEIDRDRPEERQAPVVGKWALWFQVEDVATLSLDQAVRLLRGRQIEPVADSDRCTDDWYENGFGTLRTVIDYPLSVAVGLTINPMTVTRVSDHGGTRTDKEMRLGYFLWMVAKEYERIYAEHEKYGVWGHAIGDLGFEGVVVHEDGMVDLLIGS